MNYIDKFKNLDEKNKEKVIALVAIEMMLLAFLVFCASTFVTYHNAQPEVTYENYVLNSQSIGDIYGYEDILLMNVTTTDGQNTVLYFGSSSELIDAQPGDIITARWLTYRSGTTFIDGVEVQ